VVLAAFGKATVDVNLQIAAGVSGLISLALTGALPAGITAQFNPQSFPTPPAAGFIAIQLTLTAGANLNPTNLTVSFGVLVAAAERGVFTFPLEIVAPFVSSVSPPSGGVPLLEQNGTEVTVRGGGFGPGTTVTFGADSPVSPSSIAADGSSLVVSVPATAASGQLTVTSPAGVASGAPSFAVDNYRNTRGFSWTNTTAFQNVVGGSYSFADATALFGASQTFISVFGVNVPNPLVTAFLGIADVLLDSGGQCFGMCLGSLRFANGQMSLVGFPLQPPNAEPNGPPGPDVWMLNGPLFEDGNNVSPALASFVHQQHLAQLSQESINNWVSFHASVNSAAGLRNALLQAFAAGAGAIVALNPTIGDGHAVVAYEVVDNGGGNFNILVYNPNVEFRPGEDTDPTMRANQAADSVINVMSDGTWVLPNSAAIFGQHGIPDWTGTIFNITVLPLNAMPPMPSIPWAELATVGGLAAAVIWIVTGDAAITQVSDGQGHLLLYDEQWNVDPDSQLPGARPLPAFGGLGKTLPFAVVSNRLIPMIHTITGKSTGRYDLHWVGGGHGATLVGIPISAGSSDSVLIHNGRIDFTVAQSKAATMTLVGTGSKSKLPRTATLKTTASAGTGLSLTFDPLEETFTYLHEGQPAKYTLELSTFDLRGRPISFASPAASVGKGEAHTFKPDWKRLADGPGTVSVRSHAGTVTNRDLKTAAPTKPRTAKRAPKRSKRPRG
jgi:hypothetical protein